MKAKPKARKKRARRSPHVPLPTETILAEDLFHDLRNDAEISCDRTRALLNLTPLLDRREVLRQELKARKYQIYRLVRNSLREHIRHGSATHASVEVGALWQWTQQQVSTAISRALGYGKAAVCLRDLGSHDSPEWLRDCSGDWVKMVCESDLAEVNVFSLGRSWLAPEWWYSAGDRVSSADAKEQSRALLDEAAGELRDALNDARFDAFESLWLNCVPKFTSKARAAAFRYLSLNPRGCAKDVQRYFDFEGIKYSVGSLDSLVSKVKGML